MDPALALSLPSLVGYQFLQRLGAGGMGEVFLARDDGTGDLVAVKWLSPPRGEERAHEERVAREARLVRSLGAHPHLVAVRDHGRSGGRHYFVMEYVAGGSLRQRLTPGRPLPLPETRRILAGIASALGYLHERGVVHRDLKPENALLEQDGSVKVGDFGLSAPVAEVGAVTATGAVLGTYDYMAPEQRARLPIDERADQYSFAVVAYELLTGKCPFGRFKQASQLNPRLHPAVDAALGRALQEDPDDRFGTVAEFHEALGRALALRPTPRLRGAVALAGLLLAVPALAGAVLLARGPERPAIEPTPAAVEPDEPRELLPAPATEKPLAERRAEAAYFLDLGRQHAKNGKGRDALVAFTEAVRLLPEDTEPLLLRANVAKRLRRHHEAIEDLTEAIRLDPACTEAWLGRGSIYVQLKDFPRARADLDEADRLDPKNSTILAYRGYAHHGCQNDAAAARDFEQAVALDNSLWLAHHFRGLWANETQRYDLAFASFREAVRCGPGVSFTHGGLALFLATCKDERLRDGPRAVLHAQKACELTRHQDWENLHILGQAHAAAGSLAEAVAATEKALKLAPPLSRPSVQATLNALRQRRAVEEGDAP